MYYLNSLDSPDEKILEIIDIRNYLFEEYDDNEFRKHFRCTKHTWLN